MKKLTRNIAQCRLCRDVIESTHRHDYKECKCGEIAVDGGLDYIRRVAGNLDNVLERSQYEEDGSDDSV